MYHSLTDAAPQFLQKLIPITNKCISSGKRLHAELKRAKKKSGGFGVNRHAGKWRDQIYHVEIFYHELDNYVTGKENQDLRGGRVEEDGIQRGSNR